MKTNTYKELRELRTTLVDVKNTMKQLYDISESCGDFKASGINWTSYCAYKHCVQELDKIISNFPKLEKVINGD